MKSQYQDAVKFIEDLKPHFKRIVQDIPEDDVLHALLNALEVVAVDVQCSWHGDSYKEKKTFIMTAEELTKLIIEET